MGGYKARTKRLTFPGLTDDDTSDLVWVVMRNVRTVPPEELIPEDVETGPDGTPLDTKAAMAAGWKVLAKLIIAWRVYDASQISEYDPETGEVIPGTDVQELLPPPQRGNGVNPDLMRKVPTEIITAISQELQEAQNPQRGSAATTPSG